MVLQGKPALVTGASRGIEAAIARRLAEDGADVAITCEKSADGAEEVVRGIQSHGRKGVAINLVEPGPIDTDRIPSNGPYSSGEVQLIASGR